MIVVTGAGGFIGSVLIGYLNRKGISDILIFDDLPLDSQYKNLVGKKFSALYSTREMLDDPTDIEAVIHLGANSNTLEKDWSRIYNSNVLSTRRWYEWCEKNHIPFIFSSSAAVYGNGQGPINHYAFSKWISEQELKEAVVLRLFNVYGPNEYHKGRMASTILHWNAELRKSGSIKVFENSEKYFRDFVWVEDVARTIYHFVENYKPGTYDLGTGNSVDFDSIANIIISSSPLFTKEYVAMPDDLKAQYQKNTRADIQDLKSAGVDVDNFLSIEEGITKYLTYLDAGAIY
jgi:ADP-L-glycero-D-manno-heptose 6-epimerase